MDLKDRVILVTGGGKRLGRAAALELGRAGAWVAVHHFESGEGAEEVVQQLGGQGHAYAADLRYLRDAEALVHAILNDRGRLDGIVLNAAEFPRTPFGSVTEEEWDRVFALNLKSAFFLTQLAAPSLRSAEGAVVTLTDVAAKNPWVDYLPYSLTKAGMSALTVGLAKALGPQVRVNGVAPGPVLPPEDRDADDCRKLAESTTLNRIGSADDVARTVRFLMETDYITGQIVDVDGGQGIARDRE